MDEPTHKSTSPACPLCGGHTIYRSRKRGSQDWVLYHVLFKSPYRCGTCDGRFFRSRLSHHHEEDPHQLSTS